MKITGSLSVEDVKRIVKNYIERTFDISKELSLSIEVQSDHTIFFEAKEPDQPKGSFVQVDWEAIEREKDKDEWST